MVLIFVDILDREKTMVFSKNLSPYVDTKYYNIHQLLLDVHNCPLVCLEVSP